jgi:hypothetical protein
MVSMHDLQFLHLGCTIRCFFMSGLDCMHTWFSLKFPLKLSWCVPDLGKVSPMNLAFAKSLAQPPLPFSLLFPPCFHWHAMLLVLTVNIHSKTYIGSPNSCTQQNQCSQQWHALAHATPTYALVVPVSGAIRFFKHTDSQVLNPISHTPSSTNLLLTTNTYSLNTPL